MTFFLYYFSKNNFPLLLVIGTLGGGRERGRERRVTALLFLHEIK